MLIFKQLSILALSSFCIASPIKNNNENIKPTTLTNVLPEGSDIYTSLNLTRFVTSHSDNYSQNSRSSSLPQNENDEINNSEKGRFNVMTLFDSIKVGIDIAKSIWELVDGIKSNLQRYEENVLKTIDFALENKFNEADKQRDNNNPTKRNENTPSKNKVLKQFVHNVVSQLSQDFIDSINL
ncbi:hypothetical protein BB559_000813 [Furculomyces boomerangus]|uniref:Uncharacterized protein n=2 Tax=Harpellales TaxID=61421 RepID=A0A2T9Z411_9FUNG|nr:hypothetical protein BB559_000813 [Furculomyces boomerangus]PVZ97084.1 hypothetical protein BB558_006980 [Smittium angustum]